MTDLQEQVARPGNQTSEKKQSDQAKWVGIAVTVAGLVETFAQQSESPWAGVIVAGIGLGFTVLNALGYTASRTQVKQSAARLEQARLTAAVIDRKHG